MTEPSHPDDDRESDPPFIWHESEFDVAADLGYKDVEPSGQFIRCDHIHALTEFDCSQRIEEGSEVAVRITFHLPSVEPIPSLAQDVSDFLRVFDESDKAFGGQGLQLDRAASRDGDGWLALVLLPNDRNGATDRFRRMAEQLGSPLANVPMEAPKGAASNGILADIAARWEERAAKPSVPNSPRERMSRYRIEFALVSRPHSA